MKCFILTQCNCDKEVPKASYLFYGLLIYLIDSLLLCMFMHKSYCFVSLMVNSKVSS